ncbi:hypothetical protein L083_6882 [Actinoplanes sp. N902-109]|nr:hypothetical protein L083_6882 [Actinoplanes sp. N902-109]
MMRDLTCQGASRRIRRRGTNSSFRRMSSEPRPRFLCLNGRGIREVAVDNI